MRNVTEYVGPDYESLDPALKKAMKDYLEELGINDDIMRFVESMALEQDQKLYMKWLQSSKKFLIQ